MAIVSKLYHKIYLLRCINKKHEFLRTKLELLFKLNYTTVAADYPKGLIKNNVVNSPFTNVPVNFTDNLNTFLWSRTTWMDKVGVVCGITGLSHTYGELKKLSQTFGHGLQKLGYKEGDVIAIVLPNLLETPVVLLGALAAGISVCSINPAYTSDEIKQQLAGINVVGIVTFAGHLAIVSEAISKLNRPLKIIVTPGIEKNNQITKNLSMKSNTILYEELIKDNLNKSDLPIKISKKSEDLFHISHSSGTTGMPKGIWLSHGNFINNIIQTTITKSITLQTVTSENYQDVIPLVLPIFHNYALQNFLKSIYLGAKMILLPKFDGNQYLNIMEQYHPTVLYTVPPLLQYLLSSKNLTNNHKKSLKYIFCAGAPLNVPDFNETFHKVFPGATFRQGYGLSEATCFLTMDSIECRNKALSVGLPVANTQLKVTDVVDGGDKTVNEEGEICFKGPQMTKGYINNKIANEETIDKDGWFHTGDIGYYDDDGYFYIVDRLKDMIKVKGYQVSPTELEELLKTHKSVSDVAVLGVPHDRKGEAPVAFVVTHMDNNDDNKDELKRQLMNYMEGKMASYKRIEKFIFVNSIPKTISGKILRKELKLLLN